MRSPIIGVLTLTLSCQSEKGISEDVRIVDPTTKGNESVVSRVVNVNSTDGLILPTQIWYPSQNASEGLHRYGDLKEGTASNGGVVDCSVERPVVVFSHGNTGMGYQSYFLTEFLASHGYLVVAPDHVGNTIFDNDESRKPELILRRPQDISDAYDWLLEQNEFSDCVNPDAGFAVVGHSFGGYTVHAITGAYLDTTLTLEHCAEYGGWLCEHVETIAETQGDGVYDQIDERVWGAVSMTPAALETLIGGIESITVPTLVLGGEYDTSTPVDPLVNAIFDQIGTEEKNYGIIKRTGHYTFTNACDFINTYPDCGNEYMPTYEAHALINQLTLAYLENLRGTEGMDVHLPPEHVGLLWE